ncbi:Protein kinase-like domain protein [Metarhizium guizhouense ARSEF 977]|uniref:Protein kinase-like domain protein n=1 Tax=Metarhizium guizhouense (strain ARSEF 977) TaxID=1276136 RepID=A0A0B4HTG7_METGA|nr:Protein kinase-like domain protein [Metarhizium guizhouense ARSEF 977]
MPRWAKGRLSKGRFRVVSTPSVLPEEPIAFRFKPRLIRAKATKIEKEIPNVFLLRIILSRTDQRISVAVAHLPPLLRGWFEKCFPEWSLPNRLVLKACKDGWDQVFQIEKSAYATWRSLQGIRIPRYFGALTYKGIKAILLSDIGGARVGEPAGTLLDKEEFRRLMKDTLSDLARFGALPDDTRLENFHIVGDKMMAVDFETVDEVVSASQIEDLTDWLAELYGNRQRDLLNSGKIEA